MSQDLPITEETLTGLRELREEPKFRQDLASTYPGASDEAVRERCESRLNNLIDRLIESLQQNPTKGFVLREFRSSLALFDEEDSEEQDRAALYCEQIMDIVGVTSSDGLLNLWRYGFDPSGA